MAARPLPPHLARKYSKQRNTTWRQAVAHALATGEQVVIGAMPGEDGQLRALLTEDDAKTVVRGLYNARRYCWEPEERPGIPSPDISQRPDGGWEVTFRAHPREEALAYMQAKPRHQWAYDPASHTARPRGGLTAEQRTERARHAASARWGRQRPPASPPAPPVAPAAADWLAATWRSAASKLLDRARATPGQPAVARIPTRGEYAATDATGRTQDEAAFERAVRQQAPTAAISWGARHGRGRLVQVTIACPAGGYFGQPQRRDAPPGPPAPVEGTLIGKLAKAWPDS